MDILLIENFDLRRQIIFEKKKYAELSYAYQDLRNNIIRLQMSVKKSFAKEIIRFKSILQKNEKYKNIFCETLDILSKENSIENIDLIHIDAEKMDYEILIGSKKVSFGKTSMTMSRTTQNTSNTLMERISQSKTLKINMLKIRG
jgi:hypothetical protein